MDEETKKQIDTLHTLISEVGLKINELIPQKGLSLCKYKRLIKEKEAYLNELLSIEVKERKLIETTSSIESIEMTNLSKVKDETTNKAKFSNETLRRAELVKRLADNPDYNKSKEELAELSYRKKNLLNTQSLNRSWRKYYELEILSETNR